METIWTVLSAICFLISLIFDLQSPWNCKRKPLRNLQSFGWQSVLNEGLLYVKFILHFRSWVIVTLPDSQQEAMPWTCLAAVLVEEFGSPKEMKFSSLGHAQRGEATPSQPRTTLVAMKQKTRKVSKPGSPAF